MVASPDHSVEAFQVGEAQGLSVVAFQAEEGPCHQAVEAFLAPDYGDHWEDRLGGYHSEQVAD